MKFKENRKIRTIPFSFRVLLLSIFVLSLFSAKAQCDSCRADSDPKSADFIGRTLDIFHYNGTKYLMETTPLQVFAGYKEVYPEIPNAEIDAIPGTMGFVDKNYAAEWMLLDSMLYVSAINFEDCLGTDPKAVAKIYPDNSYYTRIEKLTGRKFEKYKPLNKQISISNSGRMLHAVWFTGILYIKKPLDYKREETYSDWMKTPCYRLAFENGKLFSLTKAYKILTTELLPDKSE